MNKPAEKEKTKSPYVSMEEEALAFWNNSKIFEKSLAQEAPKGDYVFYDGPPFATGTPHYGHLVASIMKDVVPRYFTMNGYHVERKWGWDCHGLPIENIVEKELGTKQKKDIEELGVGKFNDICRSKVMTYAGEWEKVINRLGRWVDMKNSYRTMDLNFMESVWWVFKELWDKDLIYQDYRSMHICPRCETTLSQSEVTEGYRDIKDLSAIAKFELVDEPGTFILAWTTTPWTLIGNVALAVGQEIEYVKIKMDDVQYIVAKERLATIIFPGYSIVNVSSEKNEVLARKGSNDSDETYDIKIINGNELVGKSYKPLFSYYASDTKLANHDNGWKIYAGDFVTTTDGTGVVHIAPAFGEDDMNLGKANNLPFVQHVGMDGIFKPEVTDFPGMHVKPIGDHTTTDIEIIKYLAKNGLLFHKEKYEHSYPHCWRCDTPLINYATSSWFVSVSKIKDGLLESAKKINWFPEHIKEGRFGNWLEGARDWSISRQRFWASAIPIWECACGERQVIGSVAELEKLSGQKIDDIHKDKVDGLTFACAKCGGAMKRIPDVLDCWFESGSMPYAQYHYPFENKEKVEQNFPAKFIAEGVDQTRAWFYYLHVISGGIKKSHAFENVIANGIVLAEDGKKMSKRLQNYPDPYLVMEKYGADALRAQLLSSPVMAAENLNFSEKGTEESLRKNIMLLFNVYKFYELYAQENQEIILDLSYGDLKNEVLNSDNVLDKWLMLKFNALLAEVGAGMEAYNLPKAVRPITEFIDEFSTWYLRRSRDRFKSDDETDKKNALLTTKLIMSELAKVMAPFMPFMAENLWQKLNGLDFQNGQASVHLESWPVFLKIEKDETLEKMAMVRRIVEIGLAKRDVAGIKIRQMLNQAIVKGSIDLEEAYQELIKDELNIKSLDLAAGFENLEVELDIEITPELRLEGIKRELIRFINLSRKDAGLSLGDKVDVEIISESAEISEAVKKLGAEIAKETLSESLVLAAETSTSDFSKEIKIDGQPVVINLKIIK
ncbi:MAG: isoleucine--tRNA ligase [Candidatus Falkowbacteria bacterium]|nr:MAG: isoleucine--tRNA ligase [Candidatus Falkowbacteria bacterium]